MSMLITGRIKPLADPAILPAHESIAESFQSAGYRTAAIVGNPLLTRDYGYDRGLDHFVLAPEEGGMQWSAATIVDHGIAWLESAVTDDVPYFLWLHPTDPHAPYAPEGDVAFAGGISGDDSRRRAAGSLARQFELGLERADPSRLDDRAWAQVEASRARYDSDVLRFDREVARLLAVLEDRGELDTTVIVVTSDHGEGLWQRANNPDEVGRSGVAPALYDGHGAQVFEEQTHVPLIFRGPGVPRGERIMQPVALIDVVPSILALANVPMKRRHDGESLFDAGIVREPTVDHVVSVCSRVSSITVDGRWKLHEPRDYRLGHDLVDVRLYDLDADPFETTPVDDPARIVELQRRLAQWRETYAPDHVVRRALTIDQIRRLHQLGYGGEAEHVQRWIDSLEEHDDVGPGSAPRSGNADDR